MANQNSAKVCAERLSGDFNRGYTKAIRDIQGEFNGVQDDLMLHRKRFNYRLIARLLDLFLANRENFREDRAGFIRWNTKKEDLEFFDPKKS